MFQSCKNGGGTGTDSTDVDSKRAGINEAIVHLSSDAQSLNPLTSSDANSSQILKNTHELLLYTDDDTYELVPLLAVSRPKIELIDEGEYAGGMKMEFEMRPEATWDNGEPITGHDYAFTLKVLKCPAISETGHVRPYLKFIDAVEVDKENPKKFTLWCNKRYALAENGAGNTVEIIPEYAYDPNGLLKNYTVKDFNDLSNEDKFKADANLIQFAKEFTDEKYAREKGFIVGSGPYTFEKWETGQRITLIKKDDWWGNALVGEEKKYLPITLIKLYMK